MDGGVISREISALLLENSCRHLLYIFCSLSCHSFSRSFTSCRIVTSPKRPALFPPLTPAFHAHSPTPVPSPTPTPTPTPPRFLTFPPPHLLPPNRPQQRPSQRAHPGSQQHIPKQAARPCAEEAMHRAIPFLALLVPFPVMTMLMMMARAWRPAIWALLLWT